mmetsp:Transcript_43131/g.104394  ORF Transcript_43131/g.104394 Transcript_43131/m.104394 type:complete len:92 (+) Transcript_43131:103-378(+)
MRRHPHRSHRHNVDESNGHYNDHDGHEDHAVENGHVPADSASDILLVNTNGKSRRRTPVFKHKMSSLDVDLGNCESDGECHNYVYEEKKGQ